MESSLLVASRVRVGSRPGKVVFRALVVWRAPAGESPKGDKAAAALKGVPVGDAAEHPDRAGLDSGAALEWAKVPRDRVVRRGRQGVAAVASSAEALFIAVNTLWRCCYSRL